MTRLRINPEARSQGRYLILGKSLPIFRVIEGTIMRFVRTLLALLVVASVALLPMAGGALAGVNHSDTAIMASSAPMPDCCEHDATPCDQPHKSMGDCASMAACALKCFNFTATVAPEMSLSAPIAAVVPVLVSQRTDSQLGIPPFRPPRV
jgi:hypothetical protein